MTSADAALAAAASFLRAQVPTWDYRACEVVPLDVAEHLNSYVFGWAPTRTSPSDPAPYRATDNWPVLVNRDTGACRFAAGLNEFVRVFDPEADVDLKSHRDEFERFHRKLFPGARDARNQDASDGA